MPALKNPKHEAFAQAVALNMPASQAYVECVSIGGKCSEGTAEVTGCRLSKDSKVALRIAELRSKVSDAADKKFDLTKDKWLGRLAGIARKAEDSDDFNAATNALDKIGKAGGWYEAEKVTLDLSDPLKSMLAGIRSRAK